MWDTVLNWLGATGIFFSAISFRNSQLALQQIYQQNRDLKQSQQYLLLSDRKQSKTNFLNIKQQQKLILQVASSNVKGLIPKTFIRTYHDFRIGTHDSELFDPFTYNFMESETGGQFYLKANNQMIKVDIRQCNIHRNLLKKNDPQELRLFEENDPVYESVTYSMQTGVSLLLAGVLSYNFEQNQWLLLPRFLINKNNESSIKQNMKQAFAFLEQKASSQRGQKAISICVIFFILVLRSKQFVNLAKSFFNKITQFFRKNAELDFEMIQEVTAKQSDRLRCPCGKTLNIVYQCKHLSSCQACYEAAQLKQCRICGAEGSRVIKIFT